MSHFIRNTFKTGVVPAGMKKYDMANLTGKQKLTLVRNRIFGTGIDVNHSTGAKLLKKQLFYWKMMNFNWVHARDVFPYLNDDEEIARKRHMFERRRIRIVMRGVKIGQKKGGAAGDSTAKIFETKK